ncbi:MAG: hypothetical protein COA58_11550 [Bacteroidetes bacterium]|nr:MAG: hypothetical protein COA58_11550 [Bacteroidota bacterium]
MTISCLGQTTFYAADYSINKEKAQDQYYKVEQNKDTIIIQERGIFLTNPSIYAFSESKMDSLGYISIEIAFDNGEIKSNVTVNRASHNNKLYYSFLNGKLVDSLMIADSVTLLFDGPNPTFDALNSRFLQHNKTESVTLGLINWISGTLSTEQAYYIIGKSEVAIHKKETKRISFLFLNENDILPHSCYQNKESYKFRKVETLPIQLKK